VLDKWCQIHGCRLVNVDWMFWLQESEGDSDDMWDRSSESESSSSDEEVRPLGTLTADFFRKKSVARLFSRLLLVGCRSVIDTVSNDALV